MKRLLAIPSLILLIYGCSQDTTIDSTYKYIKPQYDFVQIGAQSDTISFHLNERTFNSIKSFNTFLQNDIEYISFYDQRSESVNI